MREGSGKTRIKKFYDAVTVEERGGGWTILLDGREAKTSGRAPLAAPTKPLAKAVAEEWRAGDDFVDTEDMLLTKLAWTAIDLGESESGQWTELVLSYLSSDLLCYRAEQPAALVERQQQIWDRYLDWARAAHDVDLEAVCGVAAVEQPPAAIMAVRARLDRMDAWRLIGLKSATEISGSAILGLALERRAFPARDLFDASRLDERFQEGRWGVDAEAAARERALEASFLAADKWFELLGG